MSDKALHYARSGAGPLVVFLHPVGLDGTFWVGLPARLATMHTVVCVDLRGHGRSPAVNRPGRMADFVSDVEDLIEELDAGPAVMVGVSFGGMISQNLVVKRPDLVAGLVTCACPGRIPEAGRQGILQRGIEAEAGGMEAVVDVTLERWFTPDFMETDAVASVRERLLTDDPSAFAAAWEAISGHDALGSLGGYGGRALVVAGEHDLATPLEASRALAAALDARLEVIAGAPHILQLECAEAFGDTVACFLAEKDGRA